MSGHGGNFTGGVFVGLGLPGRQLELFGDGSGHAAQFRARVAVSDGTPITACLSRRSTAPARCSRTPRTPTFRMTSSA